MRREGALDAGIVGGGVEPRVAMAATISPDAGGPPDHNLRRRPPLAIIIPLRPESFRRN